MLNILMITPEVDKNHDTRGFIYEWISNLSRKSKHLYVITIRSDQLSTLPNTSIFSLNYCGSKIRTLIYFYYILIKLFTKQEIDLVFVHMAPVFVLLTAPICFLFKKPIILWYTHGATSLIFKIAYYLSNKTVTASKNSFVSFIEESSKKIVVGHGINTNFFVSSKQNKNKDNRVIHILSISRISPSKDYKIIIKSLLGLLKTERNNFSYNIIGGPFANIPADKEYFKELKEMIINLKMKKFVKLLGPVPYRNILEYYQNCDIFINSSLTGSLDKTGLEAMACEKPVLSCNPSYLPLFGRYKDILFFDQNNMAQTVDKIKFIISQPYFYREELGKYLRQKVVKDHNLNNLIDKLINIFHNEAGK